jgi:hypothetical protein
MGYLGYKPADKPLTAADITDSIITSAKIVDGTITNSDVASSIITGQTAETSIAGGDSILIYDDSATALRKMTRTNFVSGIGGNNTPYFKANSSTMSGIAAATHTVINYDTEIYDSGSYYNTSTKRFVPLVAGYYFVWVQALLYATPAFRDLTNVQLYISKNGSFVGRGDFDAVGTGTFYSAIVNASTIIEMNGSTDYLDGQVYMNSNSGRNLDGGMQSQFYAYKIIT